MGKQGDIVPGKVGPVSGWKKSGAVQYSEMHGSKCQRSEHSETHGSHVRLSGKHNQGARGKHNQLHNAESCLGAHTRGFRKGIPGYAPAPISGSGSKKSKELGK